MAASRIFLMICFYAHFCKFNLLILKVYFTLEIISVKFNKVL